MLSWFLPCVWGPEILITPITRIVKFSLMESVLLQGFKQAIITPFFKKPTLCKEQLSNYTLVSNLLYISKVLERVVSSQLFLYLSTNKLIICISPENAATYQQTLQDCISAIQKWSFFWLELPLNELNRPIFPYWSPRFSGITQWQC